MTDWLLKVIDGLMLGWTWTFKETGYTNDKLVETKDSSLDHSGTEQGHTKKEISS